MTTERTFDWIPRHDPRSRQYSAAEIDLPYSTRRRDKLWTPGSTLDQGNEGACVGFGWTAEAQCTPVAVEIAEVENAPVHVPTAFAHAVYQRAKQLDEWAGESYSGTSVLAGAKVMQEFGLVDEYRWCFGIDQVIDTVLGAGPVVLGMNWYDGMYAAPGGLLQKSGALVGGHCLLAVGYVLAGSEKYPSYDEEPAIILQNSWGWGWGIDGLAAIRYSDLDALLQDNGEACIPTRRSYGR